MTPHNLILTTGEEYLNSSHKAHILASGRLPDQIHGIGYKKAKKWLIDLFLKYFPIGDYDIELININN